jgi:Ser/Thr protein kinase RdoA (MazF antagonist)
MPFVDTPITSEMLGAVERHWRLEVDHGAPHVRLHGGEESVAYRVGNHVVRIGPPWRTEEDTEWCHGVAAAAAVNIPEAVAPRTTSDRRTIVRVDGRLVSVWPFVDGEWADEEDPRLPAQVAGLLARLHRALARFRPPPRPNPSATLAEAPDLADADLDEWLIAFDRDNRNRQPLHGDFYRGNMLVKDGQIVGVLDWDEAFVGPPERELAWAAWEWSNGLWTGDLGDAFDFVEMYVAAGGTARTIHEVEMRQLVRQRLRWEVRYARAADQRGVALDDDDREYEAQQVDMFHRLRP